MDDDRGLAHFRPIRLRKAADEVVAAIVDGIRAGLWEPDDLLPRERDLAARLEVSRTTLREATSMLSRAGVLRVRRGNGGGLAINTRFVPASVMSEMETLGPSETRSVLQVRRAIEIPGAVLASTRATGQELEDLERLVLELHGLLDAPEEFIEVDFQFHLRVAELSGNELIAESLREILRRYSAIRSQYPVGHVALDQGIVNQQNTLDAIRSGDPERVAAAMDVHLGSVEEHFLGERLNSWGLPA